MRRILSGLVASMSLVSVMGAMVGAVAAVAAVGVAGVLSASALAAGAPVKEVLSSRVGWEVNGLTKGNVCSNECQLAKASNEAGGFHFAEGVAVQSGVFSPE
jgi:hypothetical protein